MKREEEIRKYLKVIERASALIEEILDEEGFDPQLMQQLTEEPALVAPVVQPVIAVEPEPPKAEPLPMSAEEMEERRQARNKHIQALLSIDVWPEAVPSFLMDNLAEQEASEVNQRNRATAVLDMSLDRRIENTHFLDFGCGDGWVASQAMKRGVATSTGYDIRISPNWTKLEGPKFTHIHNELMRDHYDIVMLYDVLDHCEDPLDVMHKVKLLVKKNGSVFVRCHPWTSKHANHLYKNGINKAYLHLFLEWGEVRDLIGQVPQFTRMEQNPLEAYHWWFKDFDIKKERLVQEPVSEFFFVPAFKELLAAEQNIDMAEMDVFLDRMKIQFVDYVLVPKRS